MAGCGAADVVAAIKAVADVVAEHRVELTQLDRAIGDGDHGENLNRGFTAVVAALDASTPDTPGAVLKTVATTLISKVGGAAGPLYGTAFLRAATAVADASELDAAAVVDGAGRRARRHRGPRQGRGRRQDHGRRAGPGRRPRPRQADDGGDVAAVLAAAADAADQGAAATEPLVARKGRASYLGERSAGHVDPGARSTSLMLRALAEAAAR